MRTNYLYIFNSNWKAKEYYYKTRDCLDFLNMDYEIRRYGNIYELYVDGYKYKFLLVGDSSMVRGARVDLLFVDEDIDREGEVLKTEDLVLLLNKDFKNLERQERITFI